MFYRVSNGGTIISPVYKGSSYTATTDCYAVVITTIYGNDGTYPSFSTNGTVLGSSAGGSARGFINITPRTSMSSNCGAAGGIVGIVQLSVGQRVSGSAVFVLT